MTVIKSPDNVNDGVTAESAVNQRIDSIVGRIKFIDEEQKKLIVIFLKTFCRDFILAWAVRGGVSFLPHLLKLVRLKGFNLIGAVRMSFGATAGRFGMFLALYFALFKILEKLLARYRRRRDSWNAFIAGAIASVSLIFEEEGTRWIISQYLVVRALACAWVNFQAKHPALNPYAYYGDALLFALCSGQAVYSFVVRPETVDPSYSHFLTKVTQMDPTIIKLFQTRMRTGQISQEIVGKIAKSLAARGLDTSNLLSDVATASDHITCNLIHPNMSCLMRSTWILWANFKTVFPMYFSIHLIPPVLLKFKASMGNFNQTLLTAMKNGVQSSSFMSAFVFIFQTLLCSNRKLLDLGIIKGEWKYSFWWMGFFSAASIFIEKKQRRSELSLYTLSRAGVSLYRALVDKKWLINVKHGDLAMFAFAMAIIMKSYRKGGRQLGSILTRILCQFLS